MIWEGEQYRLDIAVDTGGAQLKSGVFYGITLAGSPLFTLLARDAEGHDLPVRSTGWERVEATPIPRGVTLAFLSHRLIPGISVYISIEQESDGVTFRLGVDNTSDVLTVMELSYPAPRVSSPSCEVFLPLRSGKVLSYPMPGRREEVYTYPQHTCMQYFAFYHGEGGLYLGIEDGDAAAKRFTIRMNDSLGEIVKATCYAPGATTAGNAFLVSGVARWRAFRGDWFDAAQLYRAFVLAEASWLPPAGHARPDTPRRFRETPFWISDYIPNSPAQGENRPMNLSAGSDCCAPDYWYAAPLALRERLGVPIAYHVYNWHEIPFNIEYPHFLPAKAEFFTHAPTLRAADIAVLPYINACAWEMHDDEAGHSETFASHGRWGAAVRERGDFVVEQYPQRTRSGRGSDLAIMCGGYAPWHARMEALAREMEETLPIDGLYFDEIANMPAHPCYASDHGHAPGGGSYWTAGYNQMMESIRNGKPREHYHFTECNAEPYMKHMDGMLTWMWVDADEVPAFSAVYNGYVQLIGRCTIGNKKEDFDFFKYATARSLVSGQVLGWCKADIVDSPRHMSYLKRMVTCRYENADFLGSSLMLRPPRVTCDLTEYTSRAGLWFTDLIHSEWVLAGAFRRGAEVRLFLVNFSDRETTAEVIWSPGEYGITQDGYFPDAVYRPDGSAVLTTTLPAESVQVFSFRISASIGEA